MKKIAGSFSALALLTLFTAPSNATVLTGGVDVGSGSFTKLSVPFSDSIPGNTVGKDNFQNTNLYAFDEGQNITISRSINVDVMADGSGGGSGAGVLTAGTLVASHYVFFDPAVVARQQGFVTFDSDILAIITSTTNLGDSDFLINTGVNYLNPVWRGLEDGQDSVAITDLRTISVDWLASTPGDYIRVLTAFSPLTASVQASLVPEPASLVLLGLGLAGIGYQQKRKRLKK